MMTQWKSLALLLGLLVFAAACGASGTGEQPTPSVEENIRGTLSGRVTIGPLCPVEPCNGEVGDIYGGRELTFLQPGGVRFSFPLQPDGTFEGTMPVGTYSGHMGLCEYLGCDRAFPVTVEIKDGETTTLQIDIDTGIRAPVGASDAGQLLEDLRAAGATVEVGGPVGQAFFDVPGQALTVNGIRIEVYEYPSQAAAESNAGEVSPDGATIGLTSVFWAGSPHFYKQAALIVLYVGDDGALHSVLEGLPGPQFAGAVPDPAVDQGLTEETFSALLSVDDVVARTGGSVRPSSAINDLKEMARRVDSAQVEHMDSWYGMMFTVGDTSQGMTFLVIDFDSESAARAHYGTATAEDTMMEVMPTPIGEASAQLELNVQMIGSMLVFVQGDKFISVHTAQPDGVDPLVSLEGLEVLARLVADRL